MIKPLFIGLSGRKQTGKSTSAAFVKEIADANNLSCIDTYFAAPLKDLCHILFDIPKGQLWGSDEEKNQLTNVYWESFSWEIRYQYGETIEFNIKKPRSGAMTGREVLQIFGSDVVRRINPNAWSTYPFKQKWSQDIVTISDCRFPDEADNIKRAGGVVLRLQRDTGLTDTHVSETALDSYAFDHVYVNNGSLEDLKTYLEQFIKEHIK